MTPQRIEQLLSNALYHCSVAACGIRSDDPDLDSVMLARAAIKAVHYGMGFGEQQDTLDYDEVYDAMLELVSDTYPIVPD